VTHSPVQMQDGWPVAPPQEHGFNAVLVAAIGPRFAAWTDANMHAIVVARDGVLVYEQYFTGEDARWSVGPVGRVTYDASTKHDLRSVTKSVTSLLVGLAVDRGRIKDLDAPVFSFFPEHDDLRTPEKESITLRHLLTMSAGLAWNEIVPWDKENSERLMVLAPNLCRYVLEQPLVNRPGRVYNYCGGATELLAGILRKVSGRPLDDQASEELFGPLGITDVEWLHYPKGDLAAASGLRLRARDLAKIGQLVLDRGASQGKRIISADWIEESVTPRINGDGPYFYGYQWWLGRSLRNRREISWIGGFGLGGQRLFIVPDLNLVVVSMAGRYDSQIRIDVGSLLLNDYVLSAVH
jgi:CubicO group peptidase (beta-lactamase class C family)